MKTGIALFLLAVSPAVYAQSDSIYYTETDRCIFDQYLACMAEKDSLPFDSLILETASFFLGTPYAAATLEEEPEGLVVNLRELDCFTFVENVLALSRTVAAGEPTFERYCDQLRFIRYREGVITGYTDRLHYTSEWLYENDRKQIVKYIGRETGRQPYMFNLYFMSSHPGSYRQLKADSLLIPSIKETEQRINARTCYYHLIPKYEIDTFAAHIRDGDMVCFVTALSGLDISHVGIITRAGEMLTFMHASSTAKAVIINKESLKEYVESGKSCTGIMTARPLFPSSFSAGESPDSTCRQNNSNANLKPIL
jgi:hypothetical protein